MGYTGECLQLDSILDSFKRLSYPYTIVESTKHELNLPKCEPNSLLLVASEHGIALRFHSHCFKHIYLLDWFGTHKEHAIFNTLHVTVLTGMRTNSSEFIGHNNSQFLGYVLPPISPISNSSGTPNYGLLLGKLERYWEKKHHIFPTMPNTQFVCVKCGVRAANLLVHTQILERNEYVKLTASAQFILGAGDPIGSPSVLEALQNGIFVILPIHFAYFIMGNQHTSQHDDVLFIVKEQPEYLKQICYYTNDAEMIECVRKAQRFPPRTITAYTWEQFDRRIGRIIGSKI